jgi:gas vesicle protein
VIDSAGDGATHIAGRARHSAHRARDSAEHAAANARSTFWDGAKTVTGLLTVLRSFGTRDALGWLGLARQRNPLLSAGMFTAGFAVGAGVGILLAPASGAYTRRALRRWMAPETEAKDMPERPVAEAQKHTTAAADVAEKTPGPDVYFAYNSKDEKRSPVGQSDKVPQKAKAPTDGARSNIAAAGPSSDVTDSTSAAASRMQSEGNGGRTV